MKPIYPDFTETSALQAEAYLGPTLPKFHGETVTVCLPLKNRTSFRPAEKKFFDTLLKNISAILKSVDEAILEHESGDDSYISVVATPHMIIDFDEQDEPQWSFSVNRKPSEDFNSPDFAWDIEFDGFEVVDVSSGS